VLLFVDHQYHYYDDTCQRIRHLNALQRHGKTASKGHKTIFL